MGSNFAHDLADYDLGLDLSTALKIHLTANHYPPVPVSMVEPCIEAIFAYNEDDTKAPARRYSPEIDDLIRNEEESKGYE